MGQDIDLDDFDVTGSTHHSKHITEIPKSAVVLDN